MRYGERSFLEVFSFFRNVIKALLARSVYDNIFVCLTPSKRNYVLFKVEMFPLQPLDLVFMLDQMEGKHDCPF